MTTRDDLQRAIETAFMHCRPSGVALFAPDCTRENFVADTNCGGRDGEGRALRYLQWYCDPNPSDETYRVEFVYVLHEDGAPARTVYEAHEQGLFSRSHWLASLEAAGFRANYLSFNHSELEPRALDVSSARVPNRERKAEHGRR
jgi:hypothetical protein